MSNHGRRHNKKWLISRLKTSGSKKRFVDNSDYADTRNSKVREDWDNLPKTEGMGSAGRFNNGKINYGLLIRFLRGKVGNDWPAVHQEILERIPTDLFEYRECIEWFVADLIEKREGGLWDKRAQKYLHFGVIDAYNSGLCIVKEFYVDPDTNQLKQTPDLPANKQTQNMSPDELRAFRENEQAEKRSRRRGGRQSNT